jgi:phosphoribosylaminoimidazolecarboxamide formyltransferase / IMP cyclohydrolase
MKVRRALVSVSDKTGLVDFCKSLSGMDVEIISTGGTAKALGEAGIPVIGISEVTDFPEMLEGRVKTLHPAVHGGLLADRRKPEHMKQIEEAGIEPIDMVVVNLYPFKATVAKPGVTMDEAIENIDIGGPSMLRSAAKNFEGVAVVVDPARYGDIIKEMKASKGEISRDTRFELAREVFNVTSAYDAMIYDFLEDKEFPDTLKCEYVKVQELRYGENPHQKAAFYREADAPEHTVACAQQLHGKDLSYNNILDLDAAWGLVSEFTVPAVIIIKHTNPCGSAIAEDIHEAYRKAYDCDPVSAYGGIVAVNRPIDVYLARQMEDLFLEAIIAPAYLEEALDILTKKKNLRLLYIGEEKPPDHRVLVCRSVDGGLLVQDRDESHEARSDMKVVSKRQPTEDEWEGMLFGWRVAKHVKSNAIVFVKDMAGVGVGAGQMSRVDATKCAVMKAGENAKGAVVASDAYYPFPDALEEAAAAGATAMMEPGGSIHDDDVIAKADELGVSLVFTGARHFKH